MSAGERLQPATAKEQLVVVFHGLGPVPDRVGPDERQYWCDADRFGTVLDQIATVSRATDVPITITFDDGNMTDALIGLPALVERGLVATFFVCAGRIGQEDYLDAPAIRELTEAGMSIGSHGWSHVDWRSTDDPTLDLEIDRARETIAETIDRPVDEVAIPFGSYDRRVLKKLSSSGWRTVFTSDRGRAPINGWMIPRETYDVTWGDGKLELLATRRLPVTERIRGAAVRTAKRLR